MKKGLPAGLLVLALLSSAAVGGGVLLPKDPGIPPLAVKHLRVDIRVKDGVATVAMDQVFRNSTDRDLEAVYVFPLPENASISDFALYINGKRTSGELLEKEKARSVYQDIVRRMKDPALLEHFGGNLFRVNVYPVPKNGDQRIELTYSHPLEFESGLYKLVYPLKTGERVSATLEDFTVGVHLASAVPLKNIYSPSHNVGITRKGDNEATIGFEENKSALDRDFVLYYGVSKKDFGLNMLTHADKEGDGFFLMLIAPPVTLAKGEVIKRDVIFVFDTSGSMVGEKIQQARGALKYCVNKLNPGDRFNIVRFSTDVEPFGEGLVEANDANRGKAMEFIERIEAKGGTDISGAMAAALAAKPDGERQRTVVFLTDGQPTLGVTDTPSILDQVRKAAAGRIRIFSFGVGENVNTHLLDQLAGENGGVSQYVAPKEDIEVKVSAFYDKISLPVLTEPKVTVDKIKVREVHPQRLLDLFAGSQILIAGRYEGKGDAAIRLTGEVNGRKVEHIFEGTFPERNAENEFVPRIWATRRIGYLLDQIRLKGENSELKDEVVRLGKEYGVMTPYTAYLVVEDNQPRPATVPAAGVPEAPVPKMAPAESGHYWTGAGERRGRAEAKASTAPIPVFEGAGGSVNLSAADSAAVPGAPSQPAVPRKMQAATQERLDRYFDAKDGSRAVELSEAIRRYEGEDRDQETVSPAVRHVGKKIFYFINAVWTDRDFRKEMKAIHLPYAGDEYFQFLTRHPELKKCFALGEKVVVCLDDGSAVVVD